MTAKVLGKPRATLGAAVTLLCLLSWAGAVQAVPIVVFGDASEPNKATGILNLEISGIGTFDVAFDQAALAREIYGPFPGDLVRLPPFMTLTNTEDAAAAVNSALNDQGALAIGEVGSEGTDGFNIGWIAFILNPPLVEPIDSIAVIRSANETGEWLDLGANFLTYNADRRAWAVFSSVPEPSTMLLLGLGLAGLGVASGVRQRS